MDERLLESIDKGVDITNDYLYDIRALLTEIRDILKPPQVIAVSPNGVSTEGASWAMEATHAD